MLKGLMSVFLAAVFSLTGAEENIFRGKLNIDKSEHAVLNQDGLFYLPACHIQKSKGILFEAEQPNLLFYHTSNARLQDENGCMSILNVRAMEFKFHVIHPGNYRAWYRASYPTTYSYNHRECMDNGNISGLIEDSSNQPPNVWRWHKGPVYHLDRGEHVWKFPTPSAWCGGAKLDKLLLLPEEIDNVTDANAVWETGVRIPDQGEIVIRKIKTKNIQRWRINAEFQLNGGDFSGEYHYNGLSSRKIRIGEWENVPNGVRYLYFCFRLKKARDAAVSPFVYNLELQIHGR